MKVRGYISVHSAIVMSVVVLLKEVVDFSHGREKKWFALAIEHPIKGKPKPNLSCSSKAVILF